VADEWQSAWVEVLPDFSDFRNQANPQITTILSGAGTAGGRAASTSMGAVFGGSFFGSILANVGTRIISTITDSIRQGVAAGIDFVQASVNEASDLNESVNALNVSFGEASEGIQALGRDAATSLALSNVEFNALAVRFSAFARQIAGEGGDVTGLIDELTTRGADFASVYNIEVAEALTLFQSGLAGETEPLRRYGIDVSAATVAAYAYANGIAEQGKQLTAQQKVQAAYGALMSQTAVVAGDFANTSGELANQQRILAARFANSQAQLGTALLPAMTELANFANAELIPVLDEVIAEVGPVLADALIESIPAIRELISALSPLIPDLVKLAVEVLPVLVDLLVLISPLLIDWAANTAEVWKFVGNLIDLLQGDTTMQEFTEDTLNGSGSMFEFAKAVGQAVADSVQFFRDLHTNVVEAIRGAVVAVVSFPGRAVEALRGVGSLLLNSGRALIQGFIDGILQMARPLTDAVGGVMAFVAGFFPRSPAKHGPFSGSGWTAVKEAGRALSRQFESGLTDVGVQFAPMSIPSVAGNAALSSGPTFGGGMDPEERRLLRDLAARVVELNVDGETVARASISGSARLNALGAA
jgi:phage-related protein